MIPIHELGQWIRSGKIIKHLFRYKEACLYTFNWDYTTKPFFVSLALRLLTLGDCRIRDEQGKDLALSIIHFARIFVELTKDLFAKRSLIHKRITEIENISGKIKAQNKTNTEVSNTPNNLMPNN